MLDGCQAASQIRVYSTRKLKTWSWCCLRLTSGENNSQLTGKVNVAALCILDPKQTRHQKDKVNARVHLHQNSW